MITGRAYRGLPVEGPRKHRRVQHAPGRGRHRGLCKRNQRHFRGDGKEARLFHGAKRLSLRPRAAARLRLRAHTLSSHTVQHRAHTLLASIDSIDFTHWTLQMAKYVATATKALNALPGVVQGSVTFARGVLMILPRILICSDCGWLLSLC